MARLRGSQLRDHTVGYRQTNVVFKEKVKAVATADVAEFNTALPTLVDGIAVWSGGDRILLAGQATASQNGIWVVAAGAWTRAGDMPTGFAASGTGVLVEQGTLYADTAWICSVNSGSDVVGSNDLSFIQDVPSGVNSKMTKLDVNQAPSVTSGDESPTGINITDTPANDSYPQVFVNGILYTVGDGVKTTDCYFSSDGGVTARSIEAIVAGDELIWNGAIAEFELAVTDSVSLIYPILV